MRPFLRSTAFRAAPGAAFGAAPGTALGAFLGAARRLAGDFLRREQATVSVEAVLVMPFLLWAFTAMYAFYDVYHTRSLAIKGNYAVADLLSRETNPIDTSYLNGAGDIYAYLTRGGDDAWIRVTPVRCTRRCTDPDRRVLKRDWSRATDGKHRLTDSEVNSDSRNVIPLIAEGDRVIMVETEMQYQPKINPVLTGVGARTIRDITMTRPRFAPQLCWTGLSCANE